MSECYGSILYASGVQNATVANRRWNPDEGALTLTMVNRFLRSVRAVEAARNLTFAHTWIVASRGIRRDAHERVQALGMLVSGMRQLDKLERMVAEPFDASASR